MLRRVFSNTIHRRAFSSSASKPPPGSPKKDAAAAKAPKEAAIKSDVPGLSAKIVRPTNEPVGPGASPTGVYKVPEYFCYDRFSYCEAEIEMAKYRLPQPSAVN